MNTYSKDFLIRYICPVIFFFTGLLFNSVWAQVNPAPRVELKVKDDQADYVVFSGYIVEGTSTDSVYILLENGNLIGRPMSDVISIAQMNGKEKESIQDEVAQEEADNGMEEPSVNIPVRDLRGKTKRLYKRRIKNPEPYSHKGGYYVQLGLDFSLRPEAHLGLENGCWI